MCILDRAMVAALLCAMCIPCTAATPQETATATPAEADEIVVTDERIPKKSAPRNSVTPPPRHRPFASFSVVDHDVPDGPEFVFSEARATSDDPVFIAVAGRKMRKGDRVNRVDLQKHWLSVNVPDAYELQDRSLVTCEPPGNWEFPYCDLYGFVDPATGERHDYFLFVGNWP